MSRSRSNGELRALIEQLGLPLRVFRKFPETDVPLQSGLEGVWAVEIGFDENPVPGAEEFRLGGNPEEARTALHALAESSDG